MNPFAVAIQGLGFGAAQIALQGLLIFAAQEVVKNEQNGGSPQRRRMRRAPPSWAIPALIEEDESLLLAGIF